MACLGTEFDQGVCVGEEFCEGEVPLGVQGLKGVLCKGDVGVGDLVGVVCIAVCDREEFHFGFKGVYHLGVSSQALWVVAGWGVL